MTNTNNIHGHRLFIIGAGGHAAVVAEIALTAGYCIQGFTDRQGDLWGTEIIGYPIIGDIGKIPSNSSVVIAIGSNFVRNIIWKQVIKANWTTPVIGHPSSVISPSATIGLGTVIMPNVAVNARAKVGKVCILNTGCSVDHDCVIGDFAHICPGVRLAGNVSVGKHTMIGIGSCSRQGLSIGKDCIIGAGSVITKDIPDGVVAYGNPARVVRKNDSRY